MSLAERLKKRIWREITISLADFMAAALGDSDEGYYMRKDPFGAAGDFITAPEISQVFGELIGLWLARQWQVMGSPKAALVELGPGRGTLMNDMLRATKTIPNFHASLSVHLVETSPYLKQKQWAALADKHPAISWHDALDDVPDMPLLLVANELLDALPIRQFERKDNAWFERRIALDEKNDFVFSLVPAEAPSFLSTKTYDGIYETNDAAETLTRDISQRLAKDGGCALLIDYGYSGGTNGDTLQALKEHAFHPVLSEPGTADITAHVDFKRIGEVALSEGAKIYGPAPQGPFLQRIGAVQRADRLYENAKPEQKEAIVSGIGRILSPQHMGELFKILCIAAPSHPKPEGF